MTKFLSHGTFDIYLKGQWLYTKLTGTWNQEATADYANKVKCAVEPVMSEPWLRIVDLKEFNGGGREVTVELGKLQMWAKQHNCTYVVFISPKSIAEYMLMSAGDAYLPLKTVDSLEEAEKLAQRKMPQ